MPTLYVKTAPTTFDIGQVFSLARQMSPCLLVMEDVETIINEQTRSYAFNQLDVSLSSMPEHTLSVDLLNKPGP